MKTRPGSEKGEDLDVREVHSQLLREKSEPSEMLRAAPAWLKHGIYAPLAFWGIWQLLIASGGFNWNEYNEGMRSTVAMAKQSANKAATAGSKPTGPVVAVSLHDEGQKIYQTVCMACHQTNGMGLAGAFPPLAGSEWVTGNDRRLASIVLHGLLGPIEVKGQAWNSVMPPQGANLDDRQIAAALTYVRSEWGNEAPKVSPGTVAKIRADFAGHAPWTAETLNTELR